MGLITKTSTFSAGDTIIASEHNDNFDTIYNEFNGNINNANIKIGAAIADSKLAQITTASKVHANAITGKLSDTNLAQITTASKIAGTAIISLTNISAAAGVIPATNTSISGVFGTWTGHNAATSYLAATDGFVTAYEKDTSGHSEIFGFTDSSNPPTTLRFDLRDQGPGDQGTGVGYTMPVKKNDYWMVSPAATAIYWLPLGS